LRKNKEYQAISGLFLLVFIIVFILVPQSIAPAAVFDMIEYSQSSPRLLVILSPQYAHIDHIRKSLDLYLQAVSIAPGWKSSIILLSDEINTNETIDFLIESSEILFPLSACLIIGDDIDYVYKGDFDGMVKLSTKEWSITSANQICISILYPNPSLSFESRCNQICDTLKRFANVRSHPLDSQISIFESSTINYYSYNDYQLLEKQINASYVINPNDIQIRSLYYDSLDLVCLHGHASFSSICLNDSNNKVLSSNIASHIDTSILAIDGCYSNGIQITQSSPGTFPFLSTLCESNTLYVGLFGLLSQHATDNKNVINTMIPALIHGKTVAEAYINSNLTSDLVITGDPSFHFCFD
jgi:hypothetical protein